MNKKTLAKVTSSLLVVLLAVVMVFSVSADALNSFAYSEAGYIKEITGVDPNYKQYLNSSVMHKLPEQIGDDEEISVIVMLENPALLDTYDGKGGETMLDYYVSDEATELREKILDEKAKLTLALDEKEILYSTGAMYDTVLSGFEIVLQAKYFDELCETLPQGAKTIVSEVYLKAEAENATDGEVVNLVDVYETGIFNSSSFKYDGSGMVVAVLDTGLDYTHSAFSPSNFTSNKLGLTKDEVAKVLANSNAAEFIPGLVADDVYINEKVPFAFDYSDRDSDVYNIHNNHGTHVSGIIVGKDDTITGVAPNAQLVSIKIFSDTKDGAYTSWILAGLEDCVLLGVDVINMSLGTACGFSRVEDKAQVSGVYDKIREQGISLIVAASNSYSSAQGSEKNGNLPLTSNPDVGTVGSPSTYSAALSVASINGTKTPYINYGGKVVYFEEASDAASEEKHFVEEILPAGVNEMTFNYVVIPGAGRPADYMNIDVTDKVVLVRRGATTFEEKANAALEAGARGIIIYNNTSGDIRMSVGITSIPVCSISQDDGEKMAAAGGGSFTVGRSQAAGPFMSAFSSWGPTPDLKIKPEITAHGGNILSSITGGEYDRLSGTSMACPNMAGVVALMRQYVIESYPNQAQIKNENGEYNYYEINAIVNRLLMSTATTAINKNGLPYSVRKQGAGLASLNNAAGTNAYIITYENGEIMNKTKLELGDDAKKTGVYTLNFSVYNFGSTSLSYDISAIVMTEGVSDTLTHKGDTVVTQEGYILEGATVVASGTGVSGNSVTVNAGQTANITVTITLSESDKKYMNDSFENGMYVEGFVQLTAKSGTDVDLSVPYLAFYGDWTQAPIFDLDYYVTNADEIDDSIDTLDKTLPDAYATRPIGSVEDDYISYLGGYYFIQNPQDKLIGADRKYIALSNATGTVHGLYAVWAGLLRNVDYATLTITDASTGEVVFELTDTEIRKSYGDGGSYIYPGRIEIEYDVAEHNLKNNTQYNVKVETYLDYGEDGGVNTNLKNTFEFPFMTDFSAPLLEDVEYYTEYDRNEKKNRLFMKMAVYDNHYAMAAQVGYIGVAPESSDYERALFGFSSYLTPIYSEKDSTTYVTYELTDYLNDIKNGSLNEKGVNSPNTFTISLYDYALNFAIYEIPLPAEFVDLYFEESDITLSPNEVYPLQPLVYPATEWPELLEYAAEDSSIASVINGKLVAKKSGSTRITVYDKENLSVPSTVLNVTVLAEGDEGYRKISKPVADVYELMGYETLRAYYHLSGSDRDIGEAGYVRNFEGNGYSLSMFPSESVKLRLRTSLYFPDATSIIYESGNKNIVTVDENGVITAQQKGFASIYVRLEMDGKRTPYTIAVSIEVKDPYVRTGPWLTNYFGLGGKVEIPADLLFTEIGQYAFSNYHYIPKDLEAGDVINEEDPSTTKISYIGDDTITEVVIPEGIEKIGAYAFANLTALTKVTLPSTLKYIEYGAFYGCTNLTTVEGLEYVVTINKYAFQNCNLKGTVSLDSAHAISDYAFAGNKNLKNVVIPETLRSVGAYAFADNTKLQSVTINAEKIKLGDYAFMNCSELKSIAINANVIPTGAFLGCDELTTVILGEDVNVIAQYAFSGTDVSAFEIAEGNSAFVPSADGSYLMNAAGDTILLVAPAFKGAFTVDDSKITVIGSGAFSGVENLKSVSIPSVITVGDYAFADSHKLTTVTLGELESIGSYSFFNTAITQTPDISKIDYISPYAFAFSDVESVEIGNDVTIGEGAFTECQSLQSVTLGDNVTVDYGAFMIYADTEHERTGANNWKYVYNGKYHYFDYLSPLTELTIGKNAKLGTNAFYGASKLKNVTLGEGASIGECAFYNADSLKVIDLSGAVYVGNGAFSGNINYQFTDASAQRPAIVGNQYVLKYYTPDIETVDLSSLVDGDEGALGYGVFQYCQSLTSVVLGDGIKTIPATAFFEAIALSSINLSNVTSIGEGAFSGSAIVNADLSKATDIGNYAFVNSDKLETVTLCPDGCVIGEGAFSYATKLSSIDLSKVTSIGTYGLAYTAITTIDLSSAKTVGDLAFVKNSVTPVNLTLGESVESLGDNPFAMCVLAPISKVITEEFGSNTYESVTYTFDLNDSIKIIEGSIYCEVPDGLELTTYIPMSLAHASIAEGTVRVTAMAFAGTDIQKTTLPHSLRSIGHKAFYECDKLMLVEFKSYKAPILEEEYDPEYYNSCDHLPGTGEYELQYTNGTTVVKTGLGIVPFKIYDSFAYESHVFYGATFVDYIGHGDGNLVMVKPSNGENYESFVYNQYFSVFMDGGVAADETTLLAIEAINRMPKPVQLADEPLVIAAREAYNKIAKTEQKALVYNYADLLTAEQRIAAFKNTGTPVEPDKPIVDEPDAKTDVGKIVLIVFVIVEAVIILAGAAAACWYFFIYKKKADAPTEASEEEITEEAAAEETPAEEAPAEETTTEEAPAEETPVEEAQTDDSTERKED
ncbi:MAG: leucine-rich repeat protein [Clostridia bacterium]|nr:leucine-rich repeat protein [Clostridia bacterium]